MTDIFFEDWLPDNVDAALEEGFFHPRMTIAVKIGETIHRFIKDLMGQVIDGNEYLPLPVIKAGNIESTDGQVSDTLILTLDGSDMREGVDEDIRTAFYNIVDLNLRGAAIQVGTCMLDKDTMAPIGLASDYNGIINAAPFEELDSGPLLEFEIFSYLNIAKRQVARVYTDVDHQQLYTNDRCFQYLSDTVNREGSFMWNSKPSGSGGSVGGYSPGGASVGRTISLR